MQAHTLLVRLIVAILVMTTIGCDKNENKQLAEMAERHSQRQAEQSKQMAELQNEVAAGSRRLVEADARAREEMIALQREVQAERGEVGHQRDALEEERREFAAKRHLDPVIAAAITNIGLLAACLLPLILCWLLLCRRIEPADDHEIAEVLLEDLVADRPLLLPKAEGHLELSSRDDKETRGLPDEKDLADESV
jgi:hypothetical protein